MTSRGLGLAEPEENGNRSIQGSCDLRQVIELWSWTSALPRQHRRAGHVEMTGKLSLADLLRLASASNLLADVHSSICSSYSNKVKSDVRPSRTLRVM